MTMRLATVLTPLSEENLRLAAQCGVTDVVLRYPRTSLQELADQQQLVREFGLEVSAVEGYLPIEEIKLGRDDGRELALLKELIQTMGELGIPVLCYNFMAGTDWVRTAVDLPERGGAKVTGFDLQAAAQAKILSHDGGSRDLDPVLETLTTDQLWSSLEAMLHELLPVAEASSVALAMHPDDPPLPMLLGRPRIMHDVEAFERLVTIARSPANGICFCQGTFAAMGVDIVETIERLGPHIRYVHFRDVRGERESFVETFHDNGPTDMAAAIAAYRRIGFTGPLRPDHVPQLVGEDDGEPGYTMLGRLFAYGYIRGLLDATE